MAYQNELVIDNRIREIFGSEDLGTDSSQNIDF